MTDPFGQVRSRSRQLAVMVAVTVMPLLCRSKISVLLRIVVDYCFFGLPPMDINIVAVFRSK
jgi:hypothetical protein